MCAGMDVILDPAPPGNLNEAESERKGEEHIGPLALLMTSDHIDGRKRAPWMTSSMDTQRERNTLGRLHYRSGLSDFDAPPSYLNLYRISKDNQQHCWQSNRHS